MNEEKIIKVATGVLVGHWADKKLAQYGYPTIGKIVGFIIGLYL